MAHASEAWTALGSAVGAAMLGLVVMPMSACGTPPDPVAGDARSPAEVPLAEQVAPADEPAEASPIARAAGVVAAEAVTAAARTPVQAWREELAVGDEPARAADRLAAHYTEREAYAEAVAVVRAARGRRPEDQSLAALEAQLLMDWGRWEAALEVLDGMIEAGNEHAALRFHRAGCLRALGQVRTARDAVVLLRAEPVYATPGRAHLEAALARLAAELDQEVEAGRRLYYGEGEMLARVRSRLPIAKRQQALSTLLRRPGADRARALRCAYAQVEPALRAAALRSWPVAEFGERPLLELFLADPSRTVRAAAIGRLPDLVDSPRLVLARALQREQDPELFRLLHESLVSACGPLVELDYPDELDPEARRAVASAWQKKLILNP